MSKPELKLDWCSYAAAKYAVEHWHYSGSMPAGKILNIGVWEASIFVGAIIFGLGSGNSTLGQQYGLPDRGRVVELVRVALRAHTHPISRMIAIALRLLKRQSPKLRLVVSFADTRMNHHGGIYQAGNWLYTGESATEHRYFRIRGKRCHSRSLGSRYGKGGQSLSWLREHVDPNAEWDDSPIKYRYVMPLDAAMRAQLEPLRKPYPKRAGSETSDTPSVQDGEGGAAPTPALSSNDRPHPSSPAPPGHEDNDSR